MARFCNCSQYFHGYNSIFLTASFPWSNYQKIFWVFPTKKLLNDVPEIRRQSLAQKNKAHIRQQSHMIHWFVRYLIATIFSFLFYIKALKLLCHLSWEMLYLNNFTRIPSFLPKAQHPYSHLTHPSNLIILPGPRVQKWIYRHTLPIKEISTLLSVVQHSTKLKCFQKLLK